MSLYIYLGNYSQYANKPSCRYVSMLSSGELMVMDCLNLYLGNWLAPKKFSVAVFKDVRDHLPLLKLFYVILFYPFINIFANNCFHSVFQFILFAWRICLKLVLIWKLVSGNDIFESSDSKKNLSSKRLFNYRKISYFTPEMGSHYFW
jgi:NADH:ubiquinone oxidoreductase subunit H